MAKERAWGNAGLCGVICVLACTFLITGCGRSDQSLLLKTEYQAVFLDNGQVFFGKIGGAGTAYPSLRDVFYVQNRTNPETKQVSSVLIKRGNESHGPDMMYLNANHIVVIEGVSSESKVGQLIKEAKAQK